MIQYFEYTEEQRDIMRRFTDYYRKFPLGVLAGGFVSIPMDNKEINELETLAKEGIFEIRRSPELGVPTFYKMSKAAFNMITELEKEKKMLMTGFSN